MKPPPTSGRTLAQLTRALQAPKGQRDKSNTGKKRRPRLWYFTDDRKTPHAKHIVTHFPRRSNMGVIVRAASAEQEVTFVTACKAAFKAGRIGGYYIRLSPWHVKRTDDESIVQSPSLRHGFLGWYKTQHSPFKAHRAFEARGFVYHPMTEGVHVIPTQALDLLFITPAFTTTTHPGQKSFGHLPYMIVNRMMKRHPHNRAALGGISLKTIKRLNISALGAIDLFQQPQ